jgi:hypothetical protein
MQKGMNTKETYKVLAFFKTHIPIFHSINSKYIFFQLFFLIPLHKAMS